MPHSDVTTTRTKNPIGRLVSPVLGIASSGVGVAVSFGLLGTVPPDDPVPLPPDPPLLGFLVGVGSGVGTSSGGSFS